MQSLWNPADASKFEHDPVALRAYTSRLLGANPDLVLHGGGNTSVKVKEKNIFGEQEERLYVKGSGFDLATIASNGFTATKLADLRKLAQLSSLSDVDMMRQLKLAQVNPDQALASVEAILHAIIPFDYVDHTHSDHVVTVSNSSNGPELIKQIYPDRVLILPYVMPGFILAKQIYQATMDLDWSKYDAIILLHHGVFTFNNKAQTAYEKMIQICHRAEEFLSRKNAFAVKSPGRAVTETSALAIATLRKAASHHANRPLLARALSDEHFRAMAGHARLEVCANQGPITPDHVLHTKRLPVIINQDIESAVDQYATEYQRYFTRNANPNLQCLDPAPRYAIFKNAGMACLAPTAKRLNICQDIVSHTVKAIQWAENISAWKALSEKEIFDLEYWDLEQAKLKKSTTSPEHEGRIAIVTGAASGIGRACALQLMAQGACVMGLDINPDVMAISKSDQYLGAVVDLTKDEEIKQALEQCTRHFGGIDMLVSNAGTFPTSAPIEEIKDEQWLKSLDINCNSHFKILRASIPYLKLGIQPGVVFIGSKNVPAPGPGVAPYSVAKAGITQLARVAAMELGKYKIRVNVIHPNAVFDTGIWNSDVIAKRAKNYGLTPEAYKTNNVLGIEVTSLQVAQLVSSTLSSVFASVTGAQIPIDGGNDRVI